MPDDRQLSGRPVSFGHMLKPLASQTVVAQWSPIGVRHGLYAPCIVLPRHWNVSRRSKPKGGPKLRCSIKHVPSTTLTLMHERVNADANTVGARVAVCCAVKCVPPLCSDEVGQTSGPESSWQHPRACACVHVCMHRMHACIVCMHASFHSPPLSLCPFLFSSPPFLPGRKIVRGRVESGWR